jgi:hypothetical protein
VVGRPRASGDAHPDASTVRYQTDTVRDTSGTRGAPPQRPPRLPKQPKPPEPAPLGIGRWAKPSPAQPPPKRPPRSEPVPPLTPGLPAYRPAPAAATPALKRPARAPAVREKEKTPAAATPAIEPASQPSSGVNVTSTPPGGGEGDIHPKAEAGTADARAPGRLVNGPLAATAVVLIVASVVPLALLQLPDLLASAMSLATVTRLAGPRGAPDLVRAAGLALPVMAAAAPIGAAIARRRRAWPVLLTGLLVIGAADLLGGHANTVLLIGVDRALHGLGAGFALAATLAVAAERPPRWRRLLTRWWALAVVLSLTGSVPLLRDLLAAGGWRAALHPLPWLTVAGLAATALYLLVTGGSGPRARTEVTPAERAQLALIAVPVAAVSVLDFCISTQGATQVIAAAVIAVTVLLALAVIASADKVTGGQRNAPGRIGFPLAGAAAGFALAPTAGVVSALRPLAAAPHPALRALWLPLAAAAGASLLAAVLATAFGRALTPTPDAMTRAATPARGGSHARRRKNHHPRGGRAGLFCVLLGLACAAAGLATAAALGPAAPQQHLAVAYGLLAGGLTMALTASIAAATPAGTLAGLTLLLAGALTGYLAQAAIQIHLLGSAGPPVLARLLIRSAGVWELTAAALVVAAGLAILFIGRARRGPKEVPVRG